MEIIKSSVYDPTGYWFITYIDGTKIKLPGCGLNILKTSKYQYDMDLVKKVEDKEKELYRLLKIKKLVENT